MELARFLANPYNDPKDIGGKVQQLLKTREGESNYIAGQYLQRGTGGGLATNPGANQPAAYG